MFWLVEFLVQAGLNCFGVVFGVSGLRVWSLGHSNMPALAVNRFHDGVLTGLVIRDPTNLNPKCQTLSRKS